jgi:hypothetical protein
MTNVAQIRTNYRGTEVQESEEYIKYELYIPKKYEPDFEADVLNKEYWTWLSKAEVKII